MDRIESAFAETPRAAFLHHRDRRRAGADQPIPIGHGQTNSQPRTVAAMLRLLAVGPGHRVLDVGAGSGWSTALLAHLVGPTGRVIGVELVPALARTGAANVAATGRDWAGVRPASAGVLGAPQDAPFDRILVSAEATAMPAELVDQLGPEGRMVLPIRGTMHLVVRDQTGLHDSTHGSYRFVPLR